MLDMRKTIVIKTDQLNADDLLGGPRTIKLREVKAMNSGEQRAHLFFDGDNGKPYKPNTSMLKVLCAVWGPDGNEWVGRSMTVFNDPSVTWGGQAVGGIRISHLSHIEKKTTVVINASRSAKKPYTVEPLTNQAESAPDSANQADKPKISYGDALSDAKLYASKGKEAFTKWWQGDGHRSGARELVRGDLDSLQDIAAEADAGNQQEEPFE